MNIYEDYINYLDECMGLITELQNSNSSVLLILQDVIKVTDYIYQQYEKKSKIDEELEEIFSLGFGYLSNILSDFKTYYEEYFDKNIETFNSYAPVLIDAIVLEDFRSFLEVSDEMNEEISKEIEAKLYQIDGILANKKKYDEELLESIETIIEERMPKTVEFKPVYTVCAMISEELSLM